MSWLRKWWGLAVAFLVVAGTALLYLLVGPRRDGGDSLANTLDAAKRRAEGRVAAANARYAIEKAIARTKDAQQAAQLQAILDDENEDRRGAALIAMSKRTAE